MRDERYTVLTFYLGNADDVPNNPALPVLLYRSVLGSSDIDKASLFEQHFAANGWGGLWRNGIYDYHHFHTNAHEVLGIAAGSATVQLGGETGRVLMLGAGDLVALPAGTGHRKISADDDLLVIGAYPRGQEDYDLCRSREDCPGARESISAVALPETDPFYGAAGPLLELWNK